MSLPLPFDVARCNPSESGRARATCARAKAATNARTKTWDFSGGGCNALCDWYINIPALLQQPEAEIARVRASEIENEP